MVELGASPINSRFISLESAMSGAQNIGQQQHGLGGDIAPTPQNTPAAHLSHSVLSRPQVPSTLVEEGEEGDEQLQTISTEGVAGLANHPAFTSLVEGRLNSLIGRSSGYIESLPPAVRRRITGLKGVQVAQGAIEAEFQKEIFELEKKYAAKYAPIYNRRKDIILGKSEPTEDEVTKGEEADSDLEDSEDEDEDEDDGGAARTAVTADDIAKAPKGVPEFWLTALKNHLGLADLITERDEEALKFLEDLRVEYPADKRGFSLVFEFGEGAKAFFTQSKITKTYYYQDEVGYEGDFVYDRAEGTKIDWVEGKDLTTKVETKKQRNKNTNQTRIVKKVVPTESFFNFFNPPKPPSDEDEDADIADDIDEKLELDYQIGEDIKERVIPRAIDFFTGKALRTGMDEFESEDEFDEDDFEDDEESDEDGQPRRAPAPPSGVTPTSVQDPQECKQS